MTKGQNKQNPGIKGVLFDFDGTLTSPGALHFDAIKKEIDCPSGIPILEYLETLPLEKKSFFSKVLQAREEEAAEESIPNTGAEECLTALKEKGILLGVLTRNSLHSVQIALRKFQKISSLDFAVILTREDSLPKPHPDGVLKASRQMAVPPAKMLMVGDFRFDILAGKAAGALTALLTNDKESVMIQGDPEPDYRVSHLEEILSIIDETSCP